MFSSSDTKPPMEVECSNVCLPDAAKSPTSRSDWRSVPLVHDDDILQSNIDLTKSKERRQCNDGITPGTKIDSPDCRDDDEMSGLTTDTDGPADEACSDSSTEDIETGTAVPQTFRMDEDMESRRQRALREIATYDRIGGNDSPQATVPADLIEKLQKRKDAFIHNARTRREPYEKYQDFDAFIDELTLTDDQSWKTVQLMRKVESNL